MTYLLPLFLVLVVATVSGSKHSTRSTSTIRNSWLLGSIGLQRNDDNNDNNRQQRSNDSTEIDHGMLLVEWLRLTKGSYFHPHLEIRRRDEQSPHYGIYATSTIKAQERLIEIPRSMVLEPGPPQVGERVVAYFTDDAGGDEGGEEEEADSNSNNKSNKGDNPLTPYPGIVTAINKDGTYDMLCDGDDEEERGVSADNIDHEGFPINCATVRLLAEQLKLGEKSKFAPYVNYMLAHPTGQLPSTWSSAGQALLLEVLGHHMESYGGEPQLPPRAAFGWLEEDWFGRCGGADDEMEHQAYMLVMQSSWDEMLIPIYDMISHRNGHWLNTDCDPVREGSSIKIRSIKEIQKGDELYSSYNFCRDCEERMDDYGTPELLRDYGFVEDYPRRFIFHDQDLAFDIDYKYDNEHTDGLLPTIIDDNNNNQLYVNWTTAHPKPAKEGIHFLQTQVQRLLDLNETDFRTRNPDVPEQEWQVTRQYLDALVIAMENAIAKAGGSSSTRGGNGFGPAGSGGGGLNSCDDNTRDELCTVASDRYPKLEEGPEEWLDAQPLTCDEETTFAYDEWVTVGEFQSPYFKMEFDVNPTMNNDFCFDLDDVLQTCNSYRPQYHEIMVHFPARFIDTVQRILFVGGGDSMVLHEALKYPSLERVVGLELDQSVVRRSFQYFGTQPHWDNEKVEWWFGDAAETLKILPKDYFASFDLVLVDLSQSDAAETVTDDVKVMETLTLLLKPSGVLVHNEYARFEQLSSIFRETLRIHFYGVPAVCSLPFTLASNGVDFMRGPYKENTEVAHLFNLLDDEYVRYDIVRDYQRNATNPRHCDDWLRDEASTTATTTSMERRSMTTTESPSRSPGVLMIVEAEDSKTVPNSPEVAKEIFAGALEKVGLSVVTAYMAPMDGGFILVLILREGYVTARVWPPLYQYAAFDIHMWSHFEKQDSARKALIEAVGSTAAGVSSSAFRIAAGGMSGLADWKNDEERRGPRLEDICAGGLPKANAKKSTVAATMITASKMEEFLKIALDESIYLAHQRDIVVAVLCGQKGQECKSVKQLENHKLVTRVIPLWVCSSIGAGVEFAKDGPDRLFACEKETLEALRQSVGPTKIRAIVVDQSASYPLAQVIVRIFMNKLHAESYLTENILVQSTVVHKEGWRKVFVDKFREELFDDEPVFKSMVQFNSTAGLEFEVAITSSGSRLYPRFVTQFADRMEEFTGLVSDITSLRAGSFIWVDEFVADSFFTASSYDHTDQLKQWSAQVSLGVQAVFQMELEGSTLTLTAAQLVQAFLETLSQSGLNEGQNLDFYQVLGAQHQIGVGCILMAFWNSGNAVLLWDGAMHVDVNVFDEVEVPKDFIENFLQKNFSLRPYLLDEFPRGINRVILYQKPEKDQLPVWAS